MPPTVEFCEATSLGYRDDFVTVRVVAETPRIFQDDHRSDGSQFDSFVIIVIFALTTCRDLSQPM
jgi:hypothetical protein